MPTLEGLGTAAFNVVLILLGSLFAIGFAIGLGLWLRRLMRFKQFQVVIWERDGLGNVKERVDKAGIFVDPVTRNKRFFIKRANVGLEPDNIPYIEIGRVKKVYLIRTGLMNYRFIRPTIEDGLLTFDVGEEDVNWSINAYERQKVAFTTKKWLQYMPYISLAIMGFIFLFMVIYILKNFTVLQDVANAMLQTSENIKLASLGNGTMVIT